MKLRLGDTCSGHLQPTLEALGVMAFSAVVQVVVEWVQIGAAIQWELLQFILLEMVPLI